jgi:subtilisin family serine protease
MPNESDGASNLIAAPPSTQIIPEGVRRVGGLQSPTARINGQDDRLNADIAVLDGGVDATHPDLRVAGRVDCVGDGVLNDLDGHGTEVAGAVAAIDNNIGVVGVAPGARIWSVRIFAPDGSLTTAALLCGLDYLRANASRIDVGIMTFESPGVVSAPCGRITTPLSLFPFRLPTVQVVDPIHSAICQVTAAGVTLVAAAGNGSQDARNTIPAAYPEVIAVSAFTDTDGIPGGLGPNAACLPNERDDRFANYSNFGPVVDISAPGTCVLTTFLGNSYIVDTGTPFAAAYVAGAAGLVRAQTPFFPPTSVRAVLVARVEPGPIPGDPDTFPEGRLSVRGL